MIILGCFLMCIVGGSAEDGERAKERGMFSDPKAVGGLREHGN